MGRMSGFAAPRPGARRAGISKTDNGFFGFSKSECFSKIREVGALQIHEKIEKISDGKGLSLTAWFQQNNKSSGSAVTRTNRPPHPEMSWMTYLGDRYCQGLLVDQTKEL